MPRETAGVKCKDCKAADEAYRREEDVNPPMTARPAPYPGPRCFTHWRVEKARRSDVAHSSTIERTYGITGEQYKRLYEIQGGKCAICRRASGKTRRLSVDHNHDTGAVRGLLCSVCNRLLGHARDDPAFFDRATYYLNFPPARNL